MPYRIIDSVTICPPALVNTIAASGTDKAVGFKGVRGV